MRRAKLSWAVTVVCLMAATALADDYGDPDYLAYDLDNMRRTTQRQERHFTSRDYQDASRDAALRTWLQGAARQAGDLGHGRLYTGLGQIVPGGNMGDPERHFLGERVLVEFAARSGAKIVGNVWPCAGGGACPGVVITTGSIQATQHMYGWAARALQAAGYTVLTFDVQGQGESEGTSHEPGDPFPEPRNPQDLANFVESTIDAIHFFLSAEEDPYVPVGWTAEDVGAAKAEAGGSSKLDWHNPLHFAVDRSRLGLAGHSLGASAISRIQQCADAGGSTLWQSKDFCLAEGVDPASGNPTRTSFPIRAIVAWDSLDAGTPTDPIVPVVPALDHRSDGYFLNAVPTPQAPDPDQKLGPYGVWVAAGKDVYAITVRGGTHAEWSEIPYIVSATCYGIPQATHYLLAWFDRYLHPDPAVNAAGTQALVAGPIPEPGESPHAFWRASLFSVKYRSAFKLHDVEDPETGSPPFEVPDLRAYARVAPLRDWAAANAETEGWPNPCAAERPLAAP